MSVQLPIIFKQGDTRWGATLLGFNTNQPFNITNYGCLLSCWAMVDRYYGKITDPGTLNQVFVDMGKSKAFVASGGDYVPGGNNLAYGDIKETQTLTPSLLTDAQFAEIKTSIDNGYPVIICIDYNPKTNQPDTHFVVVIDYNVNEENDLTIADPITGGTRSLKDYLGWFKPNARNTIESYIITNGPKPKVTSATMIVEKSDWEKLLRGNGEYEKTVEYLKPGADPKVTRYEDLQTVIAGIKSTQTDLTNKLNDALTGKAAAETEVANQKDKLANANAECQRVLNLKDAQYTALKATIPDMTKLEGQYKGTIANLEGQLRESQKTVGLRDLDITALKSQLADCKKGISAWTKILAIINKYMQKK